MTSYLYTLDYSDENSPEGMFRNLHVYVIADKYDIKDLKELARKRFSTQVQKHWNDPEFPAVVQEVYSCTLSSDHGLRNIIEKTVTEHVSCVLDNDRFNNLLVGQMGELGVVVLQGVLNSMGKQKDQIKATTAELAATTEELKLTKELLRAILLQENMKANSLRLTRAGLICSRCRRSLIFPPTEAGMTIKCEHC